ncbi:MAG: VWA domain-containing protein [Deltaproteobacteria bacterium]|nr:VWA domain-containing protein [Deltaproteobacteria bacterium]
MSEFHFLRPLWFLSLPVLLTLLWLLWQRQLRSRSWQDVCDPALLPHLLLGRSQRRANWPLWLLLTALLLTVTALAGPTWRKLPQPLFRQQSALVICIDLSRSMLAADLKPNRLVRAKLKIQDILRQRREGQTALVAFAGDAFALTPLTDDRRTITALLKSLEPGLMPVQGSAPGRALELGAKLLHQAGLKQGTLLLVTDDDRPLTAMKVARQLRKQGLQLQVLGVGTPQGAPIPLAGGGFYKDRAGNLVLPGLNEAGLRQLAEAGGGAYRRISIDDSDFHTLLADLQSHRLDHAEAARNRSGDRWQEAGIWLLWPLALLASCAFRRGWLVIFVLLLLTPAPAKALSWQDLWQRPDQQAGAEFTAGRYAAAAGRFEDPRWKASALYRAGRYPEALKALPKPQTGDDWYNRGNTLARSGKLAEAIKAYDQSLKLKPGDEDTLTNRKLVEQARQQQQKQKSQSERQQGDNQQAGTNKPQATGKNQPGKNGNAGQDKDKLSNSDRPAKGEQPPAGKPPESPKDRSAQADNAQSRSAPQGRGQKSASNLEQRQSQEQQAAAAAENAPPSAEEREMRRRLQAIPDDPGGLLRRKFLYQYRNRGQQLETDRPW